MRLYSEKTEKGHFEASTHEKTRKKGHFEEETLGRMLNIAKQRKRRHQATYDETRKKRHFEKAKPLRTAS